MNKIKSVLSAVGGVLLGLFGRMSIPIYVLLGCNAIDIVTGVLSAKARGEKVKSGRFKEGIKVKAAMLLLVVVGWIVDIIISVSGKEVGIEMKLHCTVALITCVWLILAELMSILENIAQIGVPIPSFLIKIVKWMENSTEKTGDSIIPEGEKNELSND